MSSSGPLTSWTGWDVRGGASAEPGAAEAFAGGAPSGAGAGAHYELLAVVARGFRPPRFLSAVPLPDESLTGAGTEPGAGEGASVQSAPGLRQTWSLLYRQVAETGPPLVTPFAIFLLGVNPPDGTSDEELEVFNDFYTTVHMPEVAERRHALRAVRFELVRAVRPPYQGAPRFLATYEVDETSASNRRHVGPPYAAGPDVWRRHTTPWRLWYRRLVAP